MSTASFLIDDLLTKSKENSLKEENKNELTKAITSQIFGQNNLLNEFIIEKIQKEEESKIQNLEKKVCQSEEEFNNKIKLEQDINELSFKSLANQIIEQKKLENGFIPAWFSPFNQQHKGINNSLILANHCIKSLPLPTKFITNLNNKSTLNNNSNFFPFFGHFINNIYPKSTQQNYLNIQNQQKRKGGQIRFSNEQTDVLERTFETKKYLSNIERKRLARTLKLSERQVKTWFQNRRAKHRRQAPAEEDSPLTENESYTQIRQKDLFNTHNFLESVD